MIPTAQIVFFTRFLPVRRWCWCCHCYAVSSQTLLLEFNFLFILLRAHLLISSERCHGTHTRTCHAKCPFIFIHYNAMIHANRRENDSPEVNLRPAASERVLLFIDFCEENLRNWRGIFFLPRAMILSLKELSKADPGSSRELGGCSKCASSLLVPKDLPKLCKGIQIKDWGFLFPPLFAGSEPNRMNRDIKCMKKRPIG